MSLSEQTGVVAMVHKITSTRRDAITETTRTAAARPHCAAVVGTLDRVTFGPDALAFAMKRFAEEGLQDPGALASFVTAVDDLFTEYEAQLPLTPDELATAKQGFVDEVSGLASPFASLEELLESLQHRISDRRHDVMTAAGDFEGVLEELTAQALGERPGRSVKRLAAYARGLDDAAARQGTGVRDLARARLLVTERVGTELASA